MKKIIALLAIVAMGFSAKAASVTIVNNLPFSVTGNFDNVWLTGAGAASWSGTTPVTIPGFGGSLFYATTNDFFYATTGGTSFFPPTAFLYGWWFTPIGSLCGQFYGQGGLTQNYPCGAVGFGYSGFTVSTVAGTTNTTITITPYL